MKTNSRQNESTNYKPMTKNKIETNPSHLRIECSEVNESEHDKLYFRTTKNQTKNKIMNSPVVHKE